jgi:hypothetical protein
MKISSILRDPKGLAVNAIYRVGDVAELGHTISEILYCRDGYSGGAKGRQSAYAIKFAEGPQVIVIPESEILEYTVLPDEDKKKKDITKTEADVPLPD